MKNFFFAFLLLFPTLMISQVNQTRFWVGAGADDNWTTSGNWSTASGGASSNDYPSGAAAIAKFESSNLTVTVDTNITLKQMAQTGSSPANSKYTISSSGGSTLTLMAWQANSQTIQVNKANGGFKFASGMKVIANTADASYNTQFRTASSGAVISFLDGSTLEILSKNVIFTTGNAGANQYLKGIVVAGADSDIMWYGNTKVWFGTTIDTTNFLGELNGGNTANGSVATVQGTVTCQALKTSGTGTILIKGAGNVTVSGNLNTSNTSKIIVQTGKGTGNSGSLKAVNNVNAATVELQNQIDDLQADNSTREWKLIGVPVTGETLADIEAQSILSTSGSKTAIGDYDNATEAFDYYTTGATYTFTAGKGYLVSPSTDAILNFTGTSVNAANVAAAITYESGTYGPWNLVGNPYLSYLNMTDDSGDAANNFLTVNAPNINNSYEAVYAWNGTGYAAYNQSTDTKNFIAPGEGFFIYARNTGDAMNINFKETMQVVNKGAGFNAASVVKGASKSVSRFNIELKDLDNNQSDQLSFYFSNKTSKGLDPGYDAGKFNLAGSESKIFTRLLVEDQESSGIDFQIQALSNDDLKDAVVPLGITTKSSKLELSIKESTLDHLYNVYLEDRSNNTIVEFDKSIELDFDKESEGVGRFYLHFTDGMIPELPTDGDDFRIFKVSNSEIRLMGTPETNYNAKVYDFSGRLVKEINFNHRININEIDSRGINILTIESNDKKLTKKFKLN